MQSRSIRRMQIKANANMKGLVNRLKSCVFSTNSGTDDNAKHVHHDQTTSDHLNDRRIRQSQGVWNPDFDKRALVDLRWGYCQGLGRILLDWNKI
ncbi:hypothetical protein TB2_033189 [Malus domestica]